MARGAKALTRGQLLERAATLLRRLSRHLTAWDEGDRDSMEDVAGLVRTTLAYGDGDKIVERVCALAAVPVPTLRVGRPLSTEKGIVLALGSMPTPHDDQTDTRSIGLREWLASPAVAYAPVTRTEKPPSWSKLITAFGNTFGAHVSTAIPRELQEMQLHDGPNGTLGGYVLRLAAVVAEQALAEALVGAGVDAATPVDRNFYPNGIAISDLTLQRQSAETFRMTGGFTLAKPGDWDVLSFEIDEGTVFIRTRHATEETYHFEVGWTRRLPL